MTINDLHFVRITDPSMGWMIPKRLLDQVRDKDWCIERFYSVIPFVIANPNQLVGLLVDDQNNTHGFIWISLNILNEYFEAVLFSLDPEYQNQNGESIKWCIDFVKQLQKTTHVKPKIRFMSSREEAYKKHGCKASKMKIFELTWKE